jgi:hypothetical protein
LEETGVLEDKKLIILLPYYNGNKKENQFNATKTKQN